MGKPAAPDVTAESHKPKQGGLSGSEGSHEGILLPCGTSAAAVGTLRDSLWPRSLKNSLARAEGHGPQAKIPSYITALSQASIVARVFGRDSVGSFLSVPKVLKQDQRPRFA